MTDHDRIIKFVVPADATPDQIRRAGEKAGLNQAEKDVENMLMDAFGENSNWTVKL